MSGWREQQRLDACIQELLVKQQVNGFSEDSGSASQRSTNHTHPHPHTQLAPCPLPLLSFPSHICAHTHTHTGLGLKAAWVGAEIFGDLMGKGKQQQQQEAGDSPSASSTAVAAAATTTAPGVMSVDQILDSIRADYQEDYFISGKGDMAAYDPQCLFADPFVSFRGVERFKKNVSGCEWVCELRLACVQPELVCS